MLSCEQVTLQNNTHTIFQDISFSILSGAIIHLTGENGCGKTSLLRIIAGVLPPSSGQITLYKHNINDLPKPYATYIGHHHGIELEMTVMQNLLIWAENYDAIPLLQAAIQYFKYDDIALQQKCYNLSAGNLQKLSLARLVLCPSKVWLIDEFDTNLDDTNRKLIESLISTKAYGGGIVIFTSHNNIPKKGSISINLTDYKVR